MISQIIEDVLDLNQMIHLNESHLKKLRTKFLWRISESNRWPSACKADALANWANPPSFSRPEQIWTADPYIISVVL